MDQLLALGSVNIDYSLPTVLINLAVSTFFGIIISLLYRRTHSGMSYSQSFTFTLVILTVSGTILMMIVGNSLARAFSLFGAFSIIRFRTAIKDAKDIAYVFIALILGMAVGTNNYMIAMVSLLVLVTIIWYMYKTKFGSFYHGNYLLNFTHDQKNSSTEKYVKIIKKYTDQSSLVNISGNDKSKTSMISYTITVNKSDMETSLVEALQAIKGISQVTLVPLKDDIEL